MNYCSDNFIKFYELFGWDEEKIYNILNRKSTDGWTFLDYRNNSVNDRNTIFYGHNLLNKTAFGSVSKIFNKNYGRN